jgi:hypothetical protein
MSDETVDIVCPLCGSPHKYLLSIHRSSFLFGSSGNTRRIKRLFTCPSQDKTFETVLEMKEDDRGTITKVDVTGIFEDLMSNKINNN